MVCLVFVEPVAVQNQIQVGETYTNKCIRQGHTPRRRRSERRKAGAGGTHNHAKSQSQLLKFPPRAMHTNYTLRLAVRGYKSRVESKGYCPRPSRGPTLVVGHLSPILVLGHVKNGFLRDPPRAR